MSRKHVSVRMGEGDVSTEDSPDEKTESSKDRIIDQRSFELGGGLDISDFLVGNTLEAAKADDERDDLHRQQVAERAQRGEEASDSAVGLLIDPFERAEVGGEISSRAGEILRDGTVAVAAESDTITELATEGEKRLHWSLMVTMIVVYSLIGWLVGTILPPAIGGIGLILLAGFGLWLGERWIPNPNMRILGVTWVIISMKLLYGLALDLHHWGLLEEYAPSGMGADSALGALMVAIIGLNIAIAQHHDEDAIAAQATLVTLALASATGAIYGEISLALMIGFATILLHGLALLRKSGNLASLGIAASNLWIGIHALANGWSLGGLEILHFNDALLVFLLMIFVNSTNATIAARFYQSKNWFSDGFSLLGLGRPGLWGVSVALGMVGALMAIAANRSETGYALAQVVLLMAVFGGSYLAVRGVAIDRLQKYLIIPMPTLILVLVVLESGLVEFAMTGLSSYGLFAIGAAIVTANLLLKHQSSVSDHVLWLGGITSLFLLTILVPADEVEGGRILLFGIIAVCAGMALLAILRDSPSLAGVSVIAPWVWAFAFATDIETRMVGADVVVMHFSPNDLAFFLAAIVAIQQPVNNRLGATGVNLAGKLLGMSEISTRLRDSGIMQLWNIGLLVALLGILAITRPGAISSVGLVMVFSLLLLVHIGAEITGRHQNNPQFLIVSFGITALLLQWRIGLDAIWPIFISLAALPLASAEVERLNTWMAGADSIDRGADEDALQPQPESIFTLQMGLIAASLMVFYISSTTLGKSELTHPYWWPSAILTAWIFVAVVAATLAVYLPKADSFDKILQPAMASIIMIIAMIVAVNDAQFSAWPFWAGLLIFLATGGWLAAQGEIRSGIKSVARRDDRIAEYSQAQQATTHSNDLSGVKMFDPRVVELAEKQKKRRKRSGSIGEYDLIAGDIHHRPVVVLAFITGLLLGTTWWSFFSGQGESMLAFGGVTSVIFIGLSRWRASTLNLRLPDMMGIETPIAWTLLGLSLTYLSGRLSLTYVTSSDQISLLILVLLTVILAGFSLLNRPDVAIRLPSSLEWILFILAGTRLITFLLGGRMPNLFSVDPSDGDMLNWTLPWGVQEAILIMVLLVWDWVESQRLQRQLSDHRSAGGRALIVALVAIISIGPALMLAIGLALRRGFDWDQPAVGLVALPLVLVAWSSLESWSILPLFNTLSNVALIMAVVAIVLVIHSLLSIKPHWTSAWLWDAQILLPIAAVLAFSTYPSALVISLLAVSLLGWICGVLQRRRSWRVIGAINLASAWLVGLFSLQSNQFNPISALLMLVATGVVLGIVTWLNQAYEAELAND
ncbi:MAG: hypothetical protein QGH90_04170 [Candidatus Poseidoniaceae archaeon]|nr:hypothetical protein [Candidatus Poseidoniaceae archaeon]MDP7001080.1 hypothetical protein [Candidatus Poseidoniaceae archaeon]